MTDLVDMMEAKALEAAQQRARREYGTETADTARKALVWTVAEQIRREIVPGDTALDREDAA